MDIILSILKWYGIVTLVYGGLFVLYFAVNDLYRLYKNKTSGTSYKYHFVDERWFIFVMAGLAFIPVLNIIHTLLMLAMTFKPFNFIIACMKKR
jgi:hypothetical protein